MMITGFYTGEGVGIRMREERNSSFFLFSRPAQNRQKKSGGK